MDRKRLVALNTKRNLSQMECIHRHSVPKLVELTKLCALEPASVCVCVTIDARFIGISEAQLEFNGCVPGILSEIKREKSISWYFQFNSCRPFVFVNVIRFRSLFGASDTETDKMERSPQQPHKHNERRWRAQSARPKGTMEVLIRLLLSMKWVKQQEITQSWTHSHTLNRFCGLFILWTKMKMRWITLMAPIKASRRQT